MATQSFDPSTYTRSPNVNITGGIALSRTLAEGCPKSAPPPVKRAAKKLIAAADAAHAAFVDRGRELGAVSGEDPRALDLSADTVWAAIAARLEAYSTLPVALYPRAAKAAELLAKLFGPTSKPAFLRDVYAMQWTAMAAVLKRIDDDGMQRDIDDLIGPEFLSEAKRIQPLYGAMVKGVLTREDGFGQNLATHTRAMQRAIVDYAIKMCATIDEDDPATVDVARTALRPIEQYRNNNAARRNAAPPAAPNEAIAPKPAEPSNKNEIPS